MNTPPLISLETILKLESLFQRDEILPESHNDDVPNINLQVLRGSDGDLLRIYLTAELKQVANGKAYINGKVMMVGYFRMSGEIPEETINSFCEINAPAILFPFIREEFATSSIKAGLRSILLQPVDFVEMAKQSQQQIPQPQEEQQ